VIGSTNRRAKLAHLLRAEPDGIVFSESIVGDGEKVFRHACVLGAEGSASKRAGSLYAFGSRPRVAKDVVRGIQAGGNDGPRREGRGSQNDREAKTAVEITKEKLAEA
jgi:hypothetical protein